MREILFIGVPITTGGVITNNCVYGCLIGNNIAVHEMDKNFVLYTVKKETIGQFTGLCDKNGIKIFDGDILRFKRKIIEKTAEKLNILKVLYFGRHKQKICNKTETFGKKLASWQL